MQEFDEPQLPFRFSKYGRMRSVCAGCWRITSITVWNTETGKERTRLYPHADGCTLQQAIADYLEKVDGVE